ncbi:MAG: hypothetical protein BGO76_08745 [Caedibacter sp. 38-128]|nr:prepilin peptidase [Holosporales bacterium]OJX07654.1 MAG: hypothetical protein BGO76_08745 [Caedibacter sp. 38-128]
MILFFIIGLTLGSFANVLIRRLPQKNINLSTPSHCFQCAHPLSWFELIPIISWCIQKGRCKHCNYSIPLLYPLLEGTIAVSFIICFNLSSHLLVACLLSLLSYFFILVIVIDFREKIILNWLNIAISITILCLQLAENKDISLVFPATFITAFVGLGLKTAFVKIKNVHALGGGDIKLMSALSLGLEVQQLPFWFFLSGGLGLLTAIIWTKIKQEKRFPFGPALVIGFIVTYLT